MRRATAVYARTPACRPSVWPKSGKGWKPSTGSLRGGEHDKTRGTVETGMKAFVVHLKRDPQRESILRNRQQELSIKSGSRFDLVMHERNIDRAMTQSIRQTRGLGRSV